MITDKTITKKDKLPIYQELKGGITMILHTWKGNKGIEWTIYVNTFDKWNGHTSWKLELNESRTKKKQKIWITLFLLNKRIGYQKPSHK